MEKSPSSLAFLFSGIVTESEQLLCTGSAAPGHLIPLQIKSTGGSRDVVKGKRAPEMDFWFHP